MAKQVLAILDLFVIFTLVWQNFSELDIVVVLFTVIMFLFVLAFLIFSVNQVKYLKKEVDADNE